MINIGNIDNRPIVTPTPVSERRGERAAPVENAEANPDRRVERRKTPDRRDRRNGDQAFERRTSGDRRRSSIDISI